METENVAPDDLHDWAEEIMNLAGWVIDMAVILENGDERFTGSQRWLLFNAVNHYYESLEKLKDLNVYMLGLKTAQ